MGDYFQPARTLACVFALTTGAGAQEATSVDQHLATGRLNDGAEAMQNLIDADPDDHNARFSLGVVQFLQAVEGLGQDHYRYGLLAGRARQIPLMRLPVGENPNPETISYTKARAILQAFVDRLRVAEETLRAVTPDNVRVPLRVGHIRLDLNADGMVPDEETLWHITQSLQNPRRPDKATPPKDFRVVFDAGDVAWLRGYCHALSAVCEIVLAYNWEDQFERTAHLFYPNVDSPYEELQAEGTGMFMGFGPQNVLDVIAFVHTINYEVAERERLPKALKHMETVIRLSRESWTLIEAETDDEREWVPNADQTTVMKGFTVGREIIAGWHEFLDEMELILQGKHLVPYWRGVDGGVALAGRFPVNPTVGINVRKIFTQPSRFDLALWIQGTGLKPFLEEGEITSQDKWEEIMNSFQGNFVNFFFWFN